MIHNEKHTTDSGHPLARTVTCTTDGNPHHAPTPVFNITDRAPRPRGAFIQSHKTGGVGGGGGSHRQSRGTLGTVRIDSHTRPGAGVGVGGGGVVGIHIYIHTYELLG